MDLKFTFTTPSNIFPGLSSPVIKMAGSKTQTDQSVSADFTAYYLQRATKEFAEDLDKVRIADDFKEDAIPLLVSALQQGTRLFSPEEQRKIASAEPSKSG